MTAAAKQGLHTITWMQTGSNQQLDFAADEWIVLPIDLIARSLANTCRYNGQCSRYYSVAEHSVHISHMVPKELALAALLHDASEVYVGDMPPMLKRYIAGATAVSFKDLEHKATSAVARGYGIPLEHLESPIIKNFDRRILTDETQQLMPPHAYWEEYKITYQPTGIVLECWSPEEANRRFLARFEELGGQQVSQEG